MSVRKLAIAFIAFSSASEQAATATARGGGKKRSKWAAVTLGVGRPAPPQPPARPALFRLGRPAPPQPLSRQAPPQPPAAPLPSQPPAAPLSGQQDRFAHIVGMPSLEALMKLAESPNAWKQFLLIASEYCFTAADARRGSVVHAQLVLKQVSVNRALQQAKERGSPQALTMRGAAGSMSHDDLLRVFMDIVESDSPATLPGMPPGGDARHNYIIAARPLDTSGTDDEQLSRYTSNQDIRLIGESQQLVERLSKLRCLAEDFSAGSEVPLTLQLLGEMEADMSARSLHRIINIADEQAEKASTGEYANVEVESDVRRVRSLLDRRLAQAVCDLKGGTDARDVSDAVQQQLRLVRVGSIGRVKLHVIIGRNGDGWKKETPFKPLWKLWALVQSRLFSRL